MKTEINTIISKQVYKELNNPNNNNKLKLSEIMYGNIFMNDIMENKIELYEHIE